MDLVSSLGNFVLGFVEAESELKDSLDKFDVLLTKCDRMFGQATFDEISDKYMRR